MLTTKTFKNVEDFTNSYHNMRANKIYKYNSKHLSVLPKIQFFEKKSKNVLFALTDLRKRIFQEC